ncbi:MAG TPA: sulfatase-like hydrolase/transferase [Thermoanaerobaculia bacterium]|nr:sulfatase-like hydrolase/transferase [Thermoanaerobaculia bacterium]
MTRWLAGLCLLATTAGTLPAATQTPDAPNILLIVIDTLRYSATSFPDPARNNTPFLASLASRGVVFTNAYSTHDFTPTSHFSIFTGFRDGLGTDDDRYENAVPYQLGRVGYSTFATAANDLIGKKQMPAFAGFSDFKEAADVTSITVLDALTDLTEIDERLAMFHCRPTPHARAMVYFSANRLLPVFLQQIRNARPPYFGFVNLVDPHEPYIPDPTIYPPESDLPAGFDGDVLQRRLGPELRDPDSIADPERRAYVKNKIGEAGAKSLTAIDLSPQERVIYHSRYRATVRETDMALQQFFAILDKEKRLENTIVIITSDHGESFGEADMMTHMFGDRGDYESTHHVPMLIVLPRSLRTTVRTIDRKVSIANLAPTIYDLAGVDWSAFQTRYPDYPRSLMPLFAANRAHYLARVMLPKREKQDHTFAAREREKALQSLGYLH